MSDTVKAAAGYDRAAFIAAHEELCRTLGRPPTRPKLAEHAGISYSTCCGRVSSLKLAITRMTSAEAAACSMASRRERGTVRAPGHAGAADADVMELDMAEQSRRQRLRERMHEGDAGKRPERLVRPGEGQAAWVRETACCALCGRRFVLTPRTHPYWVRNAEGGVLWLCSETCMNGAGIFR